MQCAVCVCGVRCAVCSVQCAVCSVQCAVCSVQCAVTVHPFLIKKYAECLVERRAGHFRYF